MSKRTYYELPFRRRHLWLALAVAGAGCSTPSDVDPERVLGAAFVAPMSAPLYNELTARPKVIATVRHGEPVTIVGKRRRFVRVRTKAGMVGWTDSRQLIKQEGLDALQALAERAAKIPALSRATSYEPLNVHIVPNRQSPSFAQVPTGETVDVIAYEVLERKPHAFPEILPPPPKPEPKRKKKDPEIPPPEPPEPALPPNWMELSRSAENEVETGGQPPAAKRTQTPATIRDHWSLIRLKDRRCGWVLTRLLTMAIPDDVAQYSERQRITSYLALGEVWDNGEKKGIWLWTTQSGTGETSDFDGVRLFTYSVRRHRYETAYRERDLTGFLPIEAKATANGVGSSFALILETPAGLVRREYSFNGYRVQIVNETRTERKRESFLR